MVRNIGRGGVAKATRLPGPKGTRFSQKIGGLELNWDPNLDLDKPQPTPTFPVSQVYLLDLGDSIQHRKRLREFQTCTYCFEALQTGPTASFNFSGEEASRPLPRCP